MQPHYSTARTQVGLTAFGLSGNTITCIKGYLFQTFNTVYLGVRGKNCLLNY